MSAIEAAADAIVKVMSGNLSRADALRCAKAALLAKAVGAVTPLSHLGFPDYGYTHNFEVIRLTPCRGTKVGRKIRPFVSPHGYVVWNLGQRSLRRSVVVCTHYHGPRPSGMLALHNDGNPQNDTADNLRWGTMAENMADMVRHGRAGRTRGLRHGSRTKPESVLRGQAHGRAKLSSAQVLKIRESKEPGPILSDKYGVTVGRINQIRRGEGWRA